MLILHDDRITGHRVRPENFTECMKKETRRSLRDLAYYSSLGFSVSLAIFIGLAVGVLLDRWLLTSPWFTLIFLLLGIIAGFRNIALAIRKIRNY